MYLADTCLIILIINAPLSVLNVEATLWVHIILTSILTVGWLSLRRYVSRKDLPSASLDEYEALLHLEARETGLNVALRTTLFIFVLSAFVGFAARFWLEIDSTALALMFNRLVWVQMIWIGYSITRSMARKMNRDEMLSED